MTESPQQQQRRLAEVLNWPGVPVAHVRSTGLPRTAATSAKKRNCLIVFTSFDVSEKMPLNQICSSLPPRLLQACVHLVFSVLCCLYYPGFVLAQLEYPLFGFS